jgi:hypothetical protein
MMSTGAYLVRSTGILKLVKGKQPVLKEERASVNDRRTWPGGKERGKKHKHKPWKNQDGTCSFAH